MGTRYCRPLPEAERAEAEAELGRLAARLAGLMARHGGGSAMVRTWVGRDGTPWAAANLYTKDAHEPSDASPAAVLRGRVGDLHGNDGISDI